MKYQSAVYCEHANECPSGRCLEYCQCPADCACREDMCNPEKFKKNPLRETRINPSMDRKLQEDEALDVAVIGSEIVPGIYEITKFRDGVDYCDQAKGLWIWSIGRNKKTGTMYASVDTRFYQNPDYECLWLR